MKKKFFIIGLLIVVVLITLSLIIFFSSKPITNERKFDVKKREIAEIKKSVEVTIKRYEIALFSVDSNHFEKGLLTLCDEFPEELITQEGCQNVMMINQLKRYLNDDIIKSLYADVITVFPNMEEEETELKEAFSYYLKYFPNEKLPHIYTLIPGLDIQIPSIYAIDSNLFINIDMYLGSDNKHYQQFGFPKYISERCDRKYIAIDCFKKAMVYKYLPEKTKLTLLDNMIEEGKKLYFTELMFPNRSEEDIIGYSSEKYQWAEQYHGNVWTYLIEHNQLFDKNTETFRHYLEEAPFTKPFKNTSPGRMGAFIGWRIVQGYMENNKEVSLSALMEETDSQKILNKSKYKPINR